MSRVMILAGHAMSLIAFRKQLMAEMLRLGCQVFAGAPAASKEVRQELAAMGVCYRELPLQRTGTSLTSDVQYLGNLLRLLREVRPDVVLSYTIKPVIYGSMAAALAGIPRSYSMITGLGYAFSEGDSFRQNCINRLVRFLFRVSLRTNKAVFFQNPDDLDLFRSQALLGTGQRTILINGSGVDLEHYAPAPLPAYPSFLLIARLLREKGVGEYAEAARRLKRRYPQARFRLVGWIDVNPNAIKREELDAWMAEGTIDYLGLLKDIRPAMADSSVFVLPSYYREGVPRTLLEALAMGRAIVTTDAPGCRETVVAGENGFLVPVRDASSLAEAMEKFLLDPGLAPRMGKAGRRIAEGKYDVHSVNRIILEGMELLPASERHAEHAMLPKVATKTAIP